MANMHIKPYAYNLMAVIHIKNGWYHWGTEFLFYLLVN